MSLVLYSTNDSSSIPVSGYKHEVELLNNRQHAWVRCRGWIQNHVGLFTLLGLLLRIYLYKTGHVVYGYVTVTAANVRETGVYIIGLISYVQRYITQSGNIYVTQ